MHLPYLCNRETLLPLVQAGHHNNTLAGMQRRLAVVMVEQREAEVGLRDESFSLTTLEADFPAAPRQGGIPVLLSDDAAAAPFAAM